MSNFSLIILEYSDSDSIIFCKQKWINLLKLEYNLSHRAGSTKGYKHIVESVERIREASLGRKHTEQVKQIMSKYRKRENNPFFR